MRSIIRLLKKQNKGGFTLVEVVVSEIGRAHV